MVLGRVPREEVVEEALRLDEVGAIVGGLPEEEARLLEGCGRDAGVVRREGGERRSDVAARQTGEVGRRREFGVRKRELPRRCKRGVEVCVRFIGSALAGQERTPGDAAVRSPRRPAALEPVRERLRYAGARPAPGASRALGSGLVPSLPSFAPSTLNYDG